MNFTVELRKKTKSSAFLPEPVEKERFTWGNTRFTTIGDVIRARLVTGEWGAVLTRARKVAEEYDQVRYKYPEIDRLRILESLEAVQQTGLTYYDYTGTVTAWSRDAVYAIGDGNRISLERSTNCRFRGIVVVDDSPWSMDRQVFTELARYRNNMLAMGKKMKLETAEPWKVREALTSELVNLITTVWTMYSTEALPNRLEDLIQVEHLTLKWLTANIEWYLSFREWEFQKPLPLPGILGIKDLWYRDQYNRPIFENLAPWLNPTASEAVKELTMFRKAEIIYRGRTRSQVTIFTKPELRSFEHPKWQAGVHVLGYGTPTIGNYSWNAKDKHIKPFNGKGGKAEQTMTMPGWRCLTAGGIPDLKLKAHDRIVRISHEMAEDLMAATTFDDTPVLYFSDKQTFNGDSAPVLILPRGFADVEITPVYQGGVKLNPIDPTTKVEGAVTCTSTEELITIPSEGFIPEPVEAGLTRTGALSEII